MKRYSYLFVLFICINTNICAQVSKPVADALSNAQERKDDSTYLSQLQNAEHIASKINDIYGLAEVYRTIGYYYAAHNQDSCIVYHHKAYKLFMDNGYKQTGIKCLNDIAYAYSTKQNYSTALDYVSNSILMHEEIKDTLTAASLYRYAGKLKGKLGLYKLAKGDVYKAIELYTNMNIQRDIAASWKSMGSIYMLEGKADSAEIFFLKSK